MSRLLEISAIIVAGLTAAVSVFAQENTLEVPRGIFVDLKPVYGWGSFIPRSDYPTQHMIGHFSLAGKKYKVYLMRKSLDPYSEQRIIFDRADNDLQLAEEQGLPVYYPYEMVRFDTLVYEIFGYSTRAEQFVLTLKEDVPYADVGIQRGSQAVDFEVASVEGNQIRMAELRGKYVLLDFWGTWCPPCRQEIPFLKKAHEVYGAKIQFIGITVDDDEETLTQFVKENGIGWPQVIAPSDYPRTGIISDFKVRGYPSLYLIDPDGRILLGPEDQVRLRGERLLETLARLGLD